MQIDSRTGAVAPAFTVVALGLTGVLAPEALLVFLKNGVAFGIIAAAAGVGFPLARALGFADTTRGVQAIVGVALGVGTISLAVLIFGAAGMMQRPLWIAMLATLIVVAVFHVAGVLRLDSGRLAPTPPPREAWLLIAPAVFLAFAIMAATLPPGLLWPDEAMGYDVLEYHLGAPREYFEAGAIRYLPHNIYSNFPFNVEMQYLLAMVLHGDAVQAVFSAKLVNLLLGGLAVVAIGAIGLQVSKRAGIIAAVVAGTTPFVVYLSGIAYVENGMTLFAAVGLLALLKIDPGSLGAARRALAAGVLIGFAGGCKYTALPMIALPLVLFAAWNARRAPRGWKFPLIVTAGIALAMGPWLVKNMVFTGNPVFPLAYDVFGARKGIWNEECAARWKLGHLPRPEQRPVGARFDALRRQVFWNPRYGPYPAAAIVGWLGLFFGFRRRPRAATHRSSEIQSGATWDRRLLIACGLLLAATLYTWTFHTHLADRFAIPIVIPCAVIIALYFGGDRWRPFHWVLLAGVFGAVALNLFCCYRLFVPVPKPGVPAIDYLDIDDARTTDVITSPESVVASHIAKLNALAAQGQRVLMVGDAKHFYLNPGIDYCVVFNRNPFAEAAERLPPDELLRWLRNAGYDYIYVDYGEMERLRTTYGFWPSITEELFRRLTEAGLEPMPPLVDSIPARDYLVLYRIPPV